MTLAGFSCILTETYIQTRDTDRFHNQDCVPRRFMGEDFRNNNFGALAEFLKSHRESFKVMVRSAHPLEQFYKGGAIEIDAEEKPMVFRH